MPRKDANGLADELAIPRQRAEALLMVEVRSVNSVPQTSLVTWTYDPTYQLTGEQRSGTFAYDISHQYDPAGNRTLKVSSGSATTYQYDAANQLQTSEDATGTTTYQYDPAGNLQVMTAPGNLLTTNTWDGENRRTKVMWADRDTTSTQTAEITMCGPERTARKARGS